MKPVFILTFIFTALSSFGKGLNLKLVVWVDRGVLYTLNLKKDNTYKYIYSSITWDTQSTVDSGTYELKDNSIVTFHSKYPESKKSFDNAIYFIKEKKLKKQEVIGMRGYISAERKTLFGKKLIVLFKNKDDSIRINSMRPIDNINSLALARDSSLEKWINKHVLPAYSYEPNELDSSHWRNFCISPRLKVVSVNNFWDLCHVYYQIDDTIYYTHYQRVYKYQEPLIQKCYREKLIGREQKKILERLIKEWIAIEEHNPSLFR